MTLRETILEAQKNGVAVGHFNVSDIAMFYAVVRAAECLQVPVIIGVSEGEREFWKDARIVALVESVRKEKNIRIFLNADHTHSPEKAKQALEAGFDAILYDAGAKSLEENIQETKRVVEMVREWNEKHKTDVLVEGELGYIGSGSVILDRLPEGVSLKEEDLTKPEEAARFVSETGVDFLSPAVGNVHGMFSDIPNPALSLERISAIKELCQRPLILHGGSGVVADQLREAIKNGISIVHVSTELRVSWKKGLNMALLSRPHEIAPYKIFAEASYEVEKTVEEKLKLFNGI